MIYTPSDRGRGLAANDPPEARLNPGAVYRIAEVQRGQYIVVEGYNHPGGGLYWSEFTPAG